MIHTFKGFGIVNKSEVDVFVEFSRFSHDPAVVGNLISGSFAFSKSSLNIWNFTVHVLLNRVNNVNKYMNILYSYKGKWWRSWPVSGSCSWKFPRPQHKSGKGGGGVMVEDYGGHLWPCQRKKKSCQEKTVYKDLFIKACNPKEFAQSFMPRTAGEAGPKGQAPLSSSPTTFPSVLTSYEWPRTDPWVSLGLLPAPPPPPEPMPTLQPAGCTEKAGVSLTLWSNPPRRHGDRRSHAAPPLPRDVAPPLRTRKLAARARFANNSGGGRAAVRSHSVARPAPRRPALQRAPTASSAYGYWALRPPAPTRAPAASEAGPLSGGKSRLGRRDRDLGAATAGEGWEGSWEAWDVGVWCVCGRRWEWFVVITAASVGVTLWVWPLVGRLMWPCTWLHVPVCVSKVVSEFMGVIGVPVTLPLCSCHQWDWKKVEICVCFASGGGSGTWPGHTPVIPYWGYTAAAQERIFPVNFEELWAD